MSQFEINAQRFALEDIRHRKNILNFTEAELDTLRSAYFGVYGNINRDDDHGYQYWAGKHGRPEAECNHDHLFLPWHRAYLYGMEKSLQYHVPNVTLPYWNWTGPATLAADGLPDSCTAATQTDGSPNPLFAGPVRFQETSGALIDRFTRRNNQPFQSFQMMKDDVEDAFEEREYLPFQGAIDSPHGRLHVRVGGDMGGFDFAGYDPIFWIHHSNIDRLWARWQRFHDGAVVPRLDFSLSGVNMTVGKTVDHRVNLGYDYVANECFERFKRNDVAAGIDAFNSSPTQFSVADLADGFETAILEFHNVGHPLEGTRELRIFINQPDANVETPTEGNDHYAGSRILLGKSMCFGEPGHCDLPPPREKFDTRVRPKMKPVKIYMNVTKTMKKAKVVKARKAATLVTIVVLDQGGVGLPRNSVKMDGLSFIARDGI